MKVLSACCCTLGRDQADGPAVLLPRRRKDKENVDGCARVNGEAQREIVAEG